MKRVQCVHVMTKGTRMFTIPTMKPFRWSADKNETLQKDRHVSFEAMVVAIEAGGLLDVLIHPNAQKYPHQKVLVIERDGYVYLVPMVEEKEYFFFKTIIPSRKATRDYLNAGATDEKT
ncbi:MAG: hypothetical protein RLZ36_23 [Pseudomonadota bacterium]|jgi:hypothetical protein